MKRTAKFYRRNEKEVMEAFGMETDPQSGGGWIVKEDGQNEHIICQLKSTDASSFTVKKLDLDKLIYNASVSHKLPVYMVQLLESNELYIICKPDNIQDLARYLTTNETKEITRQTYNLETYTDTKQSNKKVVVSSLSARQRFEQEERERHDKTKYIR